MLNNGSTFGPYVKVRKLGHGMTAVYLARDPNKNQNVVLKLVEHADSEDVRATIAAERRGAELQAHLHKLDSRVVEVYDYGDQDGCFYVVMEYIAGEDLATRLRGGPLSPREAAEIAAETLDQLRVAHSYNVQLAGKQIAVIHGDVKPANIQLAAAGYVRLLDWGIAKTITATHRVTKHEFASRNYCSPERLENGELDAASDLWSVGVVLYEMLAGREPYRHVSTAKLEQMIVSRQPPPNLPASVPVRLRAIVRKALAPQRNQRYTSTLDFRSDLLAFLNGGPTVAEQEQPASGPAAQPPSLGTRTATTAPPPPVGRATVRIPRLQRHAAARLSGGKWGLIVAAFAAIVLAWQNWRVWKGATEMRQPRRFAALSVADINRHREAWNSLYKTRYMALAAFELDRLAPDLAAELLQQAESVLDLYRTSPVRPVTPDEMQRAGACLEYAGQLQPSSEILKSRQALWLGHELRRKARNTPAPAARQSTFEKAREQFESATRLADRWPDPYIGLAWLYAYAFHDWDKLIAAQGSGSRLGHEIGPRELVQQADLRTWMGDQAMRNSLQRTASKEARLAALRTAAAHYAEAAHLYSRAADFAGSAKALERVNRNLERTRRLLELEEQSQ